MIHTILPASGLATRMRGLPKFLLPCSVEYQTLLERHIHEALQFSEVVWIPTRPDLAPLLESLGLSSDRVVILSMATETMTETVARVASLSSADRFIVAMPDTYFLGESPWALLASSSAPIHLSCWEIRPEQAGKLGQVLISDGRVVDSRDKDPNCTYMHSWGALAFDREMLDYADLSFPHVGYLLKPALDDGRTITANVADGKYFDCGTPSEYLQMLQTLD